MIKIVNLINFIRKISLIPKCYASSFSTEADYYRGVESPIDYNLPLYYFFHFDYNSNVSQWWIVDLSRIFYIKSYKLLAGNYCNWINNWEIFTSIDNSNWNLVHSHKGFSENVTYTLNQAEPAKFVKLTGSLTNCESANPFSFAFQRIYLYGPVVYFELTYKYKFHYLLLYSLLFVVIYHIK